MQKIERTIKRHIVANLYKGYGMVIYGARRVGKTTLAKEIAAESKKKTLYINCDERTGQDIFLPYTSLELRKNIGDDIELVVIDEAQRVLDIGIKLKLLVDTYPELQVIATGSSSFDLSNKIKEPLTGRMLAYTLYPFSLTELSQVYTKAQLYALCDRLLVYGTYPRAVFGPLPAEDLLMVADNYLYKDILEYNYIKKPEILKKIVSLLASSLGSELSTNEFANTLDVRRETVESYLSLLEQSFIATPLLPFSTNIRSELTKKRKELFFDNGIRNAVLGNLSPLQSRTDVGALWENFIISQFVITASNKHNVELRTEHHFWRTTDQHQEVDLIVSTPNELHAYECTYGRDAAKKKKVPTQFVEKYPAAPFAVIHSNNFLDFLL